MLLNIKEAACAVNGEYRGSGNITVTGMFTDSREAFEGGIFFALKGERVDGHSFVNELNAKGYPCVVSEEEYFTNENILVKDVERALGDLAKWWREKYVPETKIVAVTGSVGKTTTKDMIGLVLSSEFNTFVPQGNRNSTIGLPMSVAKLVPSHEFAVFELGSSGMGEISYLSKLVNPYLSVITCVGSSHLEFFGTRDNIRKEKFSILDGEREGGVIVLDGDSDEEYAMRRSIRKYKYIFCGFHERSDFRITDISRYAGMTEYTVNDSRRDYYIKIYAEGDHLIKDSLYAFVAGLLCGVEPALAANALEGYRPYGDRQRIYQKDGVTVIADCYNASPESMRAAFGVLASREGRRIAVLGDMLELGPDSPAIHAKNAADAAEAADVLVFVGSFASVCAGACADKETYCFAENEKSAAAEKIKELIRPGDVILFKGSRRIGLDEIIKEAEL